jgi:class 3 adenylate cyclase
MADFEDQQISATQRKLTTIFSADVQGYSRLMETDEERTLTTLKQYRDAMGRLIMSHGGRVVNTWGDGLLAEFPSVVEAVRAAIDVQNELAARNAGRPTATRMVFRIGINLGDVIVEGDDIYGDGVNVAARLQTQAEPGGIVISNTVYDQVRNKVTVSFEFLGNLSVKNIAEDVPSYAVKVGESSSRAEPKVAPASAPQPAPGFCGVIASGGLRCRSRQMLPLQARSACHYRSRARRRESVDRRGRFLGEVAAARPCPDRRFEMCQKRPVRRPRHRDIGGHWSLHRRHQPFVLARGILGRMAAPWSGDCRGHPLGQAAWKRVGGLNPASEPRRFTIAP